jgi:hypothetical protein
MGLVYQKQGQYEKTLVEYHRSLDIKIQVLGYNCVDVAATYLNMANVFKRTDEYERAIEYNHKSLEIKVSMVGCDHLVTKSYYNMSCLYATRDHDLCCNMLLRAEKTGWLGTPSGTSLEHMMTDTDWIQIWIQTQY